MKLPERYLAAKRALVEATRIDEVKTIRDKALAMEVYAFQAKDIELMAAATELRKRSERAIGLLMKADRDNQRMAKAGRPYHLIGSAADPIKSLANQGVDKHLADRARKAAALEETQFEVNLAKSVKLAVAACENEKAVIRAARQEAQEEKRTRRAVRERQLSERQIALPERRYGVIVADPEWQFEPWSHETGMDRAAANHYPTSVVDVIRGRDVQSISADDCALFLWATIPMLPHALIVMAAWGFDYKSHYAWGKDKAGTGFWNREKHELLLVGVKGKIPCPAQGEQWESLIMAPRGRHSEKPDRFLEMIEGYFPNLPKIELNRRGEPRPGWDAWGNEMAEAAE